MSGFGDIHYYIIIFYILFDIVSGYKNQLFVPLLTVIYFMI